MLEYKLNYDDNSNTNARTQVHHASGDLDKVAALALRKCQSPLIITMTATPRVFQYVVFEKEYVTRISLEHTRLSSARVLKHVSNDLTKHVFNDSNEFAMKVQRKLQ